MGETITEDSKTRQLNVTEELMSGQFGKELKIADEERVFEFLRKTETKQFVKIQVIKKKQKTTLQSVEKLSQKEKILKYNTINISTRPLED